MEHLNHKTLRLTDASALKNKIEGIVERKDQKHPLDRKVQFLLDVRGYLYLNQIRGNYIEFGSFHSEMQYAAFHVLDKIKVADFYIGVDIFTGEPDPDSVEQNAMPVMAAGDFSVDFNQVNSMIEELMGPKGVIIKGDFRDENVLEKCNHYSPLALAVVDCNLLSSLQKGLEHSLRNLVNGGVLFVDDYYTNFGGGIPRIPDMVCDVAKQNGRRLIEHGFYPPFAKSFIVCQA